MKGQHTPVPWNLRFYQDYFEGIQGAPEDGERYGAMVTNRGGIAKPASAQGKANAAFIVRAVNNHDALLEIAVCLRQHLALFCTHDDDIAADIFAAADAAIAKAKGGAA